MRLQHRKYAALALLLVAAGTVQGCAIFRETQTPVEDIYASVRIAKALQVEARNIVMLPQTPDKVVEGIAVASASLTLSAEAAAKGAEVYEDAMAVVASLPQGSPEYIDALQKANIAGQAARQFIAEVLDPAIDAFRKLIAPYKEN